MSNLSRRRFLGTAAGVLAPYVITGNALGAPGIPPASERLVVGSIGVGGMGTNDMRSFLHNPECVVAALCEVDARRGKTRQAEVHEHYGNRDCRLYGDFRELLAQGDIDAVHVSTPDHWHALIAIAACRAGKDVYCQKPLALTIAESQAMVRAVRRHGRILQTGTQRRSERNFRFGCELVHNGRIGEVTHVDCELTWGMRSGQDDFRPDPMPVPDYFNYDMWLGPAPWAPYHVRRCHGRFRWILDYSGGILTDRGAHLNDIVQWGLGMDGTGPVEIEGSGTFLSGGLYDTASPMEVHYTYANGKRATTRTTGRYCITFTGTEGWIRIWALGGGIDAEPAGLLRTKIGPRDVRLYESVDPYGNFVECVRTRREPICPVEVGHRSTTICHLGNIALRLNRKLRWNPESERFVDDPEADRMRSRAMRPPWSLDTVGLV